MKLWATYSVDHTEIDVGGDRDGLRALATALRDGEALRLLLDPHGDARGLESIRVEPVTSVDARISFERQGPVLVISGERDELARIVGHAVAEVAEGPATKNGVRSHVHLDPTSDPERRYYTPDSGSLMVAFDEGE